jgi:peptide/nickel transport system substrate-binding protein
LELCLHQACWRTQPGQFSLALVESRDGRHHKELRETDPFDTEKVVEVGIKGLKEAVKNMPGIPTYGYIGFVGWDEYYWTNWPGSENAYNEPYTHWPNFKYTTPFLKQTGN